ncbi:gamma-interferon-inducible lysosomal thiol reductase-like isoform X1 [Palaemon carinicauda]|uniref:gamma-interferon-inducible lysosomal thiol reductase-like isoform X1 n=1 Tax=Palaemon carinicauda TaxID=392227 RepID=UPI0035B644C4
MTKESSACSASLAVFGAFMSYSVLLLCTGACTVSAESVSNATTPKVKVGVFYESLCPYSRNFVVNQLYPTWRSLSQIMTVDLNAYGKSHITTEGDVYPIKCQHGPAECQGNKLLTCAKKYVEADDDFIAFSHCVMDEYTALKAGPGCANRIGIDYTVLDACVQNGEGDRLLYDLSLKQSALLPPLNHVPWILIDDVYTSVMNYESEKNLRQVVCNAYKGPTPSECL